MGEADRQSVVGDLADESIRFVSVPFPGRACEWNRSIGSAFGDGASAVVTIAEGTQPQTVTVDIIGESLARHPDGILGGRILDADRPHQVHHAGYWWSDAELRWLRETYMEIIPDPTAQPSRIATWLTAAAMIIPGSAWQATGGFDERFDSFLADVDFCLRARRAGSKCVLLRDARFVTTRAPESFDAITEAERLKSTLLLAKQHALPSGLMAVTSRHVAAKITEELDRVDFWADYGTDIRLSQRAVWFLRNGFEALRRERCRRAVGETLRCAWATAGRGSAGVAA